MKMICKICNKEIDSKGDYCVFKTYQQGVYQSRLFYHIQCYLEKIKSKVSINNMAEKANALLNKAAGMMGE